MKNKWCIIIKSKSEIWTIIYKLWIWRKNWKRFATGWRTWRRAWSKFKSMPNLVTWKLQLKFEPFNKSTTSGRITLAIKVMPFRMPHWHFRNSRKIADRRSASSATIDRPVSLYSLVEASTSNVNLGIASPAPPIIGWLVRDGNE